MRTNLGRKKVGMFLVLCLLLSMMTTALATDAPSVSVAVTSATVKAVAFKNEEVEALVVIVATEDIEELHDLSKMPDEAYINIIPAIHEEKALGEEKQWLDNSKVSLSSVQYITDLPTVDSQFAQKIQSALTEQNASHVDTKQLVVRDYLVVNGTQKLKNILKQENPLNVVMDFQLTPGQPVVLLFSRDGQTWEVLPASYMIFNPDGTIMVTLVEFGVVAAATVE